MVVEEKYSSCLVMTEEDVFTCSPREDLIDGTWKKLERDLQKEGFREGALKGQEESYQTGFDAGYAEGYRLGKALGFYKGNSSLLEHLKIGKTDLVEKKIVFDENERERGCILCKKNILDMNVNDVLINQRKVNDMIISNIDCGSGFR